MKQERIYSVDALRGFCALGIMVYHFTSWSGGIDSEPLRSAFLKIGIYGVEAFFVISGFSLATAYREQTFADWRSWSVFYQRRLWRILPLLFLTVAAALGLAARQGQDITQAAIENFTVVPVILDPSRSVVAGGWSLGVELGFYLIFPVLVLARSWSKLALPLLVCGMTVASLIYAFTKLASDDVLADQWQAYVATLNHLGFFAGGMVIALVGARRTLLWLLPLPVASLVVGTVADQIETVTGAARVFALLATLVLVGAVAGLKLTPGRLTRPLIWLGDISYALYLLHPFAYGHVPLGNPVANALGAAFLALLAAHVSYNWFERPLIKLGRKMEGPSALPMAPRAPEGSALP